MITERKEVEEAFYQACADIFGTSSSYVKRHEFYRKNRWNNRKPGSGRFPGYGTIRMFNTECIHVSLNNPVPTTKVFGSAQETLDFLKKIVDESAVKS